MRTDTTGAAQRAVGSADFPRHTIHLLEQIGLVFFPRIEAILLLRAGTESLLLALHDELARKTLAIWNTHGTGQTYHHYVPWMCCLPPEDGPRAVDHPALSDQYEAGGPLMATPALSRVNEYLQLPQAAQLREDLIKDFPAGVGPRVAREQVEPEFVADHLSAREAVENAHPMFGVLYRRLIHVVILFAMPTVRQNTSLDRARGAVFMSFTSPMDRWTLALDLAHELGHQALMLLNSADPLFVSDSHTLVFSGVRRTDRPALQSLHAAAALAFMLLFTSGHGDPSSRVSVQTLAEHLQLTISSIRERCAMTEIGQTLLDDFQQLCSRYAPA